MSTRTIGFPSDPADGEVFEGWKWDGSKWEWVKSGGSGGGLWEADGDDIYYDKGNVGISGNLSTGQIDAESGTKLRTVGSGAYEIDIAGGLNLSSGRDNGADMTFEVSNSEMMRINASGNVGIGETNPTKNIDVRDATNASMVLKVTGASQFSFINDGTTADIGVTNQKDLTFSTGSNGDAERVRIDRDGNVGIGTSDFPYYGTRLYIDGGDDACAVELKSGSDRLAQFYAEAASGEVTLGTFKSNGNLKLMSAGATRMVISGDGDTTFTGNVSAPNITSRGQIIQDGAPVVDSLQIIRAFMKLRDAVDDPDSSVEELREKLKVAVVDIIDQFQEQIDNMDDIDTPVVMPAEDSE